jgi:hypothetical protein
MPTYEEIVNSRRYSAVKGNGAQQRAAKALKPGEFLEMKSSPEAHRVAKSLGDPTLKAKTLNGQGYIVRLKATKI